MEHGVQSKEQKEGSKLHALNSAPYIQNTALDRKSCLLARAVIPLVITQVLFFILSPEKALSQEISTSEISDLAMQLEDVAGKLVSIDSEYASLDEQSDAIANRLYLLRKEEEKPRSFLRKLLDMGRRRRRIGMLFTRSQELADEMSKLQEERKPLVEELIVLADEIIEKSSPRIALLGEIFLNTDYATQEEEAKQLSELSTLWGIAGRAREARDRYALDFIGPEEEWSFPTLSSDDPVELQLLAAHLRDAAVVEQEKADQLGKQIRDLELKVEQMEDLLRVSREMQRRDEEREASGVGLSQLSWDETETEREIESKKAQIAELKSNKQASEENTRRFQQQAEQIDVELKERLEDD